jgi:hypothetical protein
LSSIGQPPNGEDGSHQRPIFLHWLAIMWVWYCLFALACVTLLLSLVSCKCRSSSFAPARFT